VARGPVDGSHHRGRRRGGAHARGEQERGRRQGLPPSRGRQDLRPCRPPGRWCAWSLSSVDDEQTGAGLAARAMRAVVRADLVALTKAKHETCGRRGARSRAPRPARGPRGRARTSDPRHSPPSNSTMRTRTSLHWIVRHVAMPLSPGCSAGGTVDQSVVWKDLVPHRRAPAGSSLPRGAPGVLARGARLGRGVHPRGGATGDRRGPRGSAAVVHAGE
jgi:hypothetical protein